MFTSGAAANALQKEKKKVSNKRRVTKWSPPWHTDRFRENIKCISATDVHLTAFLLGIGNRNHLPWVNRSALFINLPEFVFLDFSFFFIFPFKLTKRREWWEEAFEKFWKLTLNEDYPLATKIEQKFFVLGTANFLAKYFHF